MRGLAKQSAERYPSTLAFAAALRGAIEGVAVDTLEETPGVVSPHVTITSDFTPPPVSPASVSALPVSVLSAPTVHGAVTERLIRRTRRRMFKVPRRLAMAALVGAAVFLWFSPLTRGPTRAAVQRAAHHVQPLIGRLAAALHIGVSGARRDADERTAASASTSPAP